MLVLENMENYKTHFNFTSFFFADSFLDDDGEKLIKWMQARSNVPLFSFHVINK